MKTYGNQVPIGPKAVLDPGASPGLYRPRTKEEAAIEFEAIFWRRMLDSMLKTSSGSPLAKGPYAGLLKRELSLALAGSKSLGIADAVLRDVLNSEGNLKGESHPGLVVPVHGRLTSGFGFRIDPFTKKRAFHAGVDIAAPIGTPVSAATGGKVVFAGEKPGYGKTAMIENDSGLLFVYGHLHEIGVEVGERVKAGEVIGKVGDTGRSTGPHLHFEVRTRNGPVNPLDVGLDVTPTF